MFYPEKQPTYRTYMVINYKKLNPNCFHLLKYLQDASLRFIILYGGSSSAKSFSIAQTVIIMTLQDAENTKVFRKVGAALKDSIYEAFKEASKTLNVYQLFDFKERRIICKLNGAKITFSGLDDSEKIKGLENYKRVFLEEFSDFEHGDFKQIRKRLRGKHGQQIICSFNPIKITHWIKKEIFDKDKWHDVPMGVTLGGKKIPEELTEVKSLRMNEPKQIMNVRTKEIVEHPSDTVLIQSTYLNNFWVVGSPDGTYGYYDEQCVADFEKDRINDPDYYNVYALGEWGVIRTGSEFFGSFRRGRDSGERPYSPNLPVHLSVDNNVLPFISISYWQVDLTTGIKIWQFHETCAESPNNTVRKSSKLTAKYLHSIGYCDKLYVHGDASTRAANTFDDEKRSWMDLFIETLKKEGFEIEDKVGDKNPSVAMTGEFINAIFDSQLPGIEICIDESCAISLEDYMSVQKDVNGAILKTKVKNSTTKQSYEEHGHLCFTGDTLVYTERGLIPISKIVIGDYVITDTGLKYVYNSLCTSVNSQYFLVTLRDKILKATIDHPVLTQRGFVPIGNLMVGDEITTIQNGLIWKEKLENITVSDLFVTHKANVKAILNILRGGLKKMENGAKNRFIATCGCASVVKYLKVIVSIILMVITIIIQSITFPLCFLMSMKNTIPNIILMIYGRKSKKDLIKAEKRQMNGISLKKGDNGIRKMRVNKWLNVLIKISFAKYVARCFNHVRFKAQSSVQMVAKANGDDYQELTMKNVFVQFVGLNLLSINILKRSSVHAFVPLKIGGKADLYDISVDGQRFFANGILVHNCDTFRYIVHDLCYERFIEFSNRRKRNLYAGKGMLDFFNPDTVYDYSDSIVYIMPNVAGTFLLIHTCRCGDKWHLTDALFRDASSIDEIKGAIMQHEAKIHIIECSQVYYQMVRELRENMKGADMRVKKEFSDMDKRIAATSDFIKKSLLLSSRKLDESQEYGDFVTNLMDYNVDSDNKGASTILSGWGHYVIKSRSD